MLLISAPDPKPDSADDRFESVRRMASAARGGATGRPERPHMPRRRRSAALPSRCARQG
jgi:hypothetical protein